MQTRGAKRSRPPNGGKKHSDREAATKKRQKESSNKRENPIQAHKPIVASVYQALTPTAANPEKALPKDRHNTSANHMTLRHMEQKAAPTSMGLRQYTTSCRTEG